MSSSENLLAEKFNTIVSHFSGGNFNCMLAEKFNTMLFKEKIISRNQIYYPYKKLCRENLLFYLFSPTRTYKNKKKKKFQTKKIYI